MAGITIIRPDDPFLEALAGRGGEKAGACMQCGGCSAVCALAPDKTPFPRRQMLLAQWGQKERLLGDPALWLCYQCQDCSRHCPRGARPGDVLAGLRHLAVQEFARPRLAARLFQEARFLPLVFGLPVLLLLAGLGLGGHLRFPAAEGTIAFWKFAPLLLVNVLFGATALAAAALTALGVRRAWRAWSAERAAAWPSLAGLLRPAAATAWEVLTHGRFAECAARRDRRLPHLGLFWSFLALFAVTTLVFLGVHLFGQQTPYSIRFNPIKWLANLGALVLIGSALLVLFQRLFPDQDGGRYAYADWLFLLVVLGAGVTGLAAEALRALKAVPPAYLVYFAHLVFVWVLFAMLPFSKFAHLVYRTAALLHARLAGAEAPRGNAP